MNFLVTNDDGIDFIGLQVLRDKLSSLGNVYTFAPTKERSGTSSAITIFDDVHVKKVNNYDFIVDGFPVDCVNIGLNGNLVDIKFDYIISGINKGVNMGQDVYYSGTVGAARHGFIHGYKSIAISCGNLDEYGDYSQVASFLHDFIYFTEKNRSLFSNKFLFNINFPTENKIPDQVKFTLLGNRIYGDQYAKKDIGKNEYYLNLGGSILGYKEEAGTDFEAYGNNKISVTPLAEHATSFTKLKQYQNQFKQQQLSGFSFHT